MNNTSFALNILKVDEQENVNSPKINHLYKSEHKKTRENKVILLMISDNECNASKKQHYLAVKKLNGLLEKGR